MYVYMCAYIYISLYILLLFTTGLQWKDHGQLTIILFQLHWNISEWKQDKGPKLGSMQNTCHACVWYIQVQEFTCNYNVCMYSCIVIYFNVQKLSAYKFLCVPIHQP